MADDPNEHAADWRRINIHEDYEVRYRTEALGVSKEKLEGVIRKVGPMADAVRKELGK